MKLSRTKKNFLILLIFLLTLNLAKTEQNQWCWTKSMANDPNWVFNQEAGNINWGYCNSDDNAEKLVTYEVQLKASSLPGSILTNSISIEIFGSQGALDEKQINLGSSKIKKEKFTDKDIGVLNKITIFIKEGLYRCKDINVLKGSSKYTFRCVTKLGPCSSLTSFSNSCMADLIPDGDTEYSVTIKTSDGEGTGTSSPVLITIIGKNAASDFLMFSDKGLDVGSKITKSFSINDIGGITGFSIKLETPSTFKPDYIMISQTTSNQMRQWPLTNSKFGPSNPIYKFDVSDKGPAPQGSQEHAFILNNGNFNAKLQNMFKQMVSSVSLSFTADINAGQDGGMEDTSSDEMDPEEMEKIIDLTCDQLMINPSPDEILFGDNYPTPNINYMNIIARCPANCHKVVDSVIGLGIHPEDTPICMAAMVDNAISDYGGTISLSIYPGQKFYGAAANVPQKLKNNISINSAISKAKKSFVVAKIENPDLTEKDYRILDHNGQLSHEGRFELRINGRWRTVCNKRLSLSAARMICKELEYVDGRWDEDTGCESFNGENYCGSQNYLPIFSDLICQPTHKKFSECNKKIADETECDRSLDAILQCTNSSYDLNKSIDKGTVKLESVENDDTGTIGRLEYYLRDFGTICNLGATDKTAELACKKMGYKKGQIEDSKRFRRSTSDTTPIVAFLRCGTSDNALENCKAVTKNINCDHSQDLVIKCMDGDGDFSGRSQYPKEPAIGPPSLGKLGLVSVVAECKTYGNNIKFRGDPGSIYYVTCPADCNKVSGTVWGTGLYALNSSLCLAAIHSGVIKSTGGKFAYIKTWGQSNYKGTYANEISTNGLSRGYSVSFGLSILNSVWKSQMNWAESQSGRIYLEKSTTVTLKDMSSKFVKNILYQKNPNMFTSFLSVSNLLSTKIEIPKPVWEWLESDSTHKFSNTGAIQITNNPLGAMQEFSVLMQIKMTEFKGKAYLFSCDANNGFNVFLDERDNLFIGSSSGADSTDTLVQIPSNQMVVISIISKNGKLSVQIIGSTVKIKDFKKKVKIMQCDKLGIGRHAINPQDYFYGLINFVQFFNFAIDPTMVPFLIGIALKKPRASAKLQSSFTVDSRVCLTSCTNAPTPGNPGAPKMPAEADPFPVDVNSLNNDKLGKESCGYVQTDAIDIVGINTVHLDTVNLLIKQNSIDLLNTVSMNTINTINTVNPVNTANTADTASRARSSPPGMDAMPVGMGSNPTRTGGNGNINISHQYNVKMTYLSCEMTLRDKLFDGVAGEKFRIKCDEDCSLRKDVNVFGSAIYAPDSSVCKAAYHSGILEKGSVGYIVVVLLEGKKIYNQSIGSDGSLSITSGPETRSFITRFATPPIKIGCNDSATKSVFSAANTGKKFLVLCPAGCAKSIRDPVYGEEVYADMSPLCPAAIHWGIITDKGGEFEFMIEGSRSSYKGTKGFGVDSVLRAQWIRSFRLLGTRSTIYKKFKEDFQGKFADKYTIFPDPTLYTVPTEGWAYNKINSVVINEDKALWAISNKTKITSNSNYGTWIILKNGEFVNGRIRSSWMFSQLLTHSILFRFQDANNFYAIEFNLDNKIGPNIRLIKRIESSNQTVAQIRRKIFVSKWYKITILLNFDAITVLLQSDSLRIEETIFESKIEDIFRGSIGFAANGATDYKISGIEIDNHLQKNRMKDSNKNKRNWNKILLATAEKDRTSFCANEFMKEDPNLKYCLMPRVYCRIRCDDVINPIENIANYNCFKDCVKTVNIEDSKLKNVRDQKAKKDKEANKDLPDPKIGTKVDFMPPYGKTNQDYTPGTIKASKPIEGKFFVDIEYENGINNIQLDSNLEYPGDGKRIKKCKSVLLKRSDCEDAEKDKATQLS